MQLIFDPRYRRLVDFFSLDSYELDEPHVEEKILFLYDWGEKKVGSDNVDSVLSKLQSFKKQLGDTLRGKPLLQDLYKFARLDAEKMIAKERLKIQNETAEERKEREEKMFKKEEEKIRAWQQTKEQIYQEKEEKDLENRSKANIVARMIKSEDKQQSKTNVNYKIAKDELPKAVRVKPYDKEISE